MEHINEEKARFQKLAGIINEDLRNWFSKDHPDGDWKRVDSTGKVVGDCAREDKDGDGKGDGPKPKCLSKKKRQELSKKERGNAAKQKRKHDKDANRKGKPINVSNYGKGKISEGENKPNNPELWKKMVNKAKNKFDIYPSAYANGWAAKEYKKAGGTWRSEKNETLDLLEDKKEDNTYMFFQNLKTIKHAVDELLKMDESKVSGLLSGGHGWAMDHVATSCDDVEEVYHFIEGNLGIETDENPMGGKLIYSDEFGTVEEITLNEAEYKGKKVKLGKPFRTPKGPKKFSVYAKNDKGNVVKVNFGDPNMEIKRDDPERRKSFRARHNCSDPGPRWKPRYWSCWQWRAGAKVQG